jgi:sodium transport system permease protein
MAVLCGVVILIIQFFGRFLVRAPSSWTDFASTTVVNLVAFIATPALLMAVMLTLRPRKTLLLNLPRWSAIPAAVALAVAVHPVAMVLLQAVARLYPVSPETLRMIQPFQQMLAQAPLWSVLLVIALVPAVCEELAFRGFILSGLRRSGHKWGAIVVSSIFFGVAHGMLQQSLGAVAVGIVIGFIAVQSGSLLPGILFHLTYNSLTVLSTRVTPELLEAYPMLGLLFQPAGGMYIYSTYVVAVAGVATILLLLWFRQLPYQPTEEERLRYALKERSLPAGTS